MQGNTGWSGLPDQPEKSDRTRYHGKHFWFPTEQGNFEQPSQACQK